MDSSTKHIIEYVGKHTALLQTIKTIDNANKVLATNMATQFGNVTKIVSQTYKGLGTTQIQTATGLVTQNLTELSTVAETSSGKMLEFKERMTTIDGQLKVMQQLLKMLQNRQKI